MTETSMQNFVKEYYGKVLQKSDDLKTSACCTSEKPPSHLQEALDLVPDAVKERYYGCGSPLPAEIEGLSLLDLGSGSGRDCYVASKLVGPSGKVTGVDMTEEQLNVARSYIDEHAKTLGYPQPNLEFKLGYIEFLEETGLPKESIDLVISNCVVNLSPNKPAVLQSVYDVLKPGGEFYFSDVYCDRRLPKNVQEHELLFGECLAGALYKNDFERLTRKVGFEDPRILTTSPIEINDTDLNKITGEAQFYSITYRLFKLNTLETLCEDYGQVATYLGGVPGQESGYRLDDHHYFPKGKPSLVCGNTASMLEETRLQKYFQITGNRSTHFGLFDCATPSAATDETTSGGTCC